MFRRKLFGKETPKLNVVFFDIEVDFDPKEVIATTDDPVYANNCDKLLYELD